MLCDSIPKTSLFPFKANTVALLLLLRSVTGAVEVSWSPPSPSFTNAVTIEMRHCTQGGFLHWGVNARHNHWQTPAPAYWPPDSYAEGLAVRSPLAGPDSAGVCRITIGPFSASTQTVSSIDFAILWADGSWDNCNELDYHIPITSARISTFPEDPGVSDPIHVTIHRSPGAGWLRWGVNALHGRWRSPNRAYWPPGTVPTPDGLAVETPFPAPDSNGRSFITLGPFDSGLQVVTTLHMAVRWPAGRDTSDWDSDGGRNYNVLTARNLNGAGLKITQPADGDTVTCPVTARVEVAGSMPVTLWLNGQAIATLEQPPYLWRIPLDMMSYGPYELVAQGRRDGKTLLARVHFWHTPHIHHEPTPPNVPLGATCTDDGTVTFALYAPHKRFVSLVGDFNDWNPAADVMNASPDGTWWIRKTLPPGIYKYQYIVDGRTPIADPYSRDVEWKDAAGNETWRPELARSVIAVAAAPYAWRSAGYRRPSLDALIIYEFSIADFCPEEGFRGVINRLDYMTNLGVTALEPLPWTECSDAGGWGYNPAFHFAPDSGYGTPNDLKQFVDEAHAREMAVIMDMVLNHMGPEAPLYQLYEEDYDSSPYFHRFLGENWGMPDLDQKDPSAKRYIRDVLTFWLTEYRVDGFRYDATRWVGWHGYNDWGASWFAYAVQQCDTGAYQIAEHLPPDPLLIQATELDAGWDSEFCWRLRDQLRNATLDPASLRRVLDPAEGGFRHAFERVIYVESHDEERLFGELLVSKKFTKKEIFRRAETALAVTLTAPGIPMIYAGQEWGESTRKRVGPNPLRWHLLNEPARRHLHDRFRILTRLRSTHPALRNGDIKILFMDTNRNVCAYQRSAGNEGVVVVVNFGRKAQEIALDLPFAGRWMNILQERPITVRDRSWGVTLGGGDTAVLVGERANP